MPTQLPHSAPKITSAAHQNPPNLNGEEQHTSWTLSPGRKKAQHGRGPTAPARHPQAPEGLFGSCSSTKGQGSTSPGERQRHLGFCAFDGEVPLSVVKV